MKKVAIVLSILILLQTSFANSIETFINNHYNKEQPQVKYNGFSDMEQFFWAKEAVDYFARYGVIDAGENFFPQKDITRGEFIKILILAFGLYNDNATSNFADVFADSWQYPYVSSAKELGITLGIREDYFGADEFITREQLTVLVYKTALLCNLDLTDVDDEITFADNSQISSYARQAVAVFKSHNVISGDDSNYFNPRNNANRAEACKIIYEILVKALENFDNML